MKSQSNHFVLACTSASASWKSHKALGFHAGLMPELADSWSDGQPGRRTLKRPDLGPVQEQVSRSGIHKPRSQRVQLPNHTSQAAELTDLFLDGPLAQLALKVSIDFFDDLVGSHRTVCPFCVELRRRVERDGFLDRPSVADQLADAIA